MSRSQNVPALDSPDWVSILPKMKQGPHRQHFYPVQNAFGKVFTHVKLTIWPGESLSCHSNMRRD
jgi:allantoicase